MLFTHVSTDLHAEAQHAVAVQPSQVILGRPASFRRASLPDVVLGPRYLTTVVAGEVISVPRDSIDVQFDGFGTTVTVPVLP